jgi:hypothetical protein
VRDKADTGLNSLAPKPGLGSDQGILFAFSGSLSITSHCHGDRTPEIAELRKHHAPRHRRESMIKILAHCQLKMRLSGIELFLSHMRFVLNHQLVDSPLDPAFTVLDS